MERAAAHAETCVLLEALGALSAELQDAAAGEAWARMDAGVARYVELLGELKPRLATGDVPAAQLQAAIQADASLQAFFLRQRNEAARELEDIRTAAGNLERIKAGYAEAGASHAPGIGAEA